MQNCDLLLSVGSRLSTPLIGRNTKPLLEMQKIVVDIDEHELSKGTINIDIAIQSDAKKFLSKILDGFRGFQTGLNGLPNVKSGRKCFLRTLMTAFV